MAEISTCRIAFSGRKCHHTISINESFAKGLQYMTNERESFGRLLTRLRSEKQISQKELAQKALCNRILRMQMGKGNQ